MENNNDGPYLTLHDLSERWGIAANTIYRWRSNGKGPRGMKFGRHLRFRMDDVRDFEESVLDKPRHETDQIVIRSTAELGGVDDGGT